jgi:hypothetical protein
MGANPWGHIDVCGLRGSGPLAGDLIERALAPERPPRQSGRLQEGPTLKTESGASGKASLQKTNELPAELIQAEIEAVNRAGVAGGLIHVNEHRIHLHVAFGHREAGR